MMKIKQAYVFGGILGIIIGGFWAVCAFSFLLPAEQLLQNNTLYRTAIKRMTLHHRIEFLEGFYSPTPFSCQETIYFNEDKNIRGDYTCNGSLYTFIQSENTRQLLYHKKSESLEQHPPHFLFSLFLSRNTEVLIKSLSYYQFISTEEVEPETLEATDAQPLKDKKKEEMKWKIQGNVSLARLGIIDKSSPQKMEKNVTLWLSSPHDSGKNIWFEKDLFLPQKIEHEGKEIIFKNYREVPDKQTLLKHSFRYPQTIEIREAGIPGIVLESQFDQFEVNPKFDKAFFQSSNILKQSGPKNSYLSEEEQAVLEKFIKEYR